MTLRTKLAAACLALALGTNTLAGFATPSLWCDAMPWLPGCPNRA